MSPGSETVTVFAAAKINLFLHVGEKRADGYHALRSLVAFADAGDVLTLNRADRLSLTVEGPFAAGLDGAGNLVTRAAKAFADATGQSVNVRMVLTKNLPVSSGIGGGSADAAAALRGLAQLYPGTDDATLMTLAENLGSDVPVCLASKSCLMEGRGEKLTPAQIPKMQAVLVNPGVAVSTAEVFRRLKTRTGTETSVPVSQLKSSRNDLEAPAREISPAIGEVLDELSRMPGITLWRMSGSGATCFGLFESGFEAELAAAALSSSHPDWWVKATTLGG
ncbi:MAG TPA: 4-(cytidine 5'-diphospho)-2-C-methyl-D-erythritol kinase [Rhizomicrobium sp.]